MNPAKARLSIIERLKQKGMPGGIGPFPEPLNPQMNVDEEGDLLDLVPGELLPSKKPKKKKEPLEDL